MDELPGETGFRLPAEFEPHEATWMAWPHDERTWIAGLEPAEEAFARMIEAVSRGERVELIVRPEDRARAEERLSTRDTGDLRLHEKDHADAWLRDTGPTVLVRDGDRVAVDWRFDAWGGKYEDLKRDDDVAAFVAGQAGIPHLRVEEVCEGGAIEPNGQGTLLSTSRCLVDGRGHASTEDVEHLLERVLGTETVLWLEGGLVGDDTDGHVDTVARFVAEDRIALATSPGPEHPDHGPLSANRRRIAEASTPGGEPFDVVELPHPERVEIDGQPRPATYANFYVANDAVLLPVYQDPHDAEAHEVLDDVFPSRRIVDVPATPLVAGYGACHCLTQPIPTPA